MKERQPLILAQNLRMLEDPHTIQYLGRMKMTMSEDENNSSKIRGKVEEIQERWRIENSEKMRNNFDYEMNLLASVKFTKARETW